LKINYGNIKSKLLGLVLISATSFTYAGIRPVVLLPGSLMDNTFIPGIPGTGGCVVKSGGVLEWKALIRLRSKLIKLLELFIKTDTCYLILLWRRCALKNEYYPALFSYQIADHF